MTFTPAQLLACAFALLLTFAVLAWHAMDKIAEGRTFKGADSLSVTFPLVPKASANVSPLIPVTP